MEKSANAFERAEVLYGVALWIGHARYVLYMRDHEARLTRLTNRAWSTVPTLMD